MRTLTADDDGSLVPHRVLICGPGHQVERARGRRTARGGRASSSCRRRIGAPNANAYAERFVRLD